MRRAVARAEVDDVELRVVDNAVPVVAAAAGLPPLAAPGLGSHGHDGIGGHAIGLCRIARHNVELPHLLAGLGVIGGHVAAGAQVATAIADDHQPILRYAGGAGDGDGLTGISRLRVPYLLAILRVDGDHSPIERADVQLAVPRGQTAAHGATAGDSASLRG